MQSDNDSAARKSDLNELLGVKRDAALAHLDKCIKTHAKLTFARERYDEAEVEQHGIAVLDLIDQYGVVLREALANAGEAERLRKDAERHRWQMDEAASEIEQLHAAARFALDTLETHSKQYPHMQKGYTVDAIGLLRRLLTPNA